MNTSTAITLILFALAIGLVVFNFFARRHQLKKIKREKEYVEELHEIVHKLNLHMITLIMYHDYKPEDVVDMLLEGVKRHKFDSGMAKTAFSLYNSFTEFIDSTRENGIIK